MSAKIIEIKGGGGKTILQSTYVKNDRMYENSLHLNYFNVAH